MIPLVYLVDADLFQEIREDGKLYVDKTDLVYHLINVKQFKYVLPLGDQ